VVRIAPIERNSALGAEDSAAVEQSDLDLAVFTKISAAVQPAYADTSADEWDSSPFQWIRHKSSRSKGKIGEDLVRFWATRERMRVERPTDSGHDCRIDGVPVEVKLSLVWAGGQFCFQQIRDQSYEVVCLLGLEPQRVHLWAVPKSVLWPKAIGQHTGATGQDTRWLRFPAAHPPEWLAEYGPTLSKARAALEETRRNLGV